MTVRDMEQILSQVTDKETPMHFTVMETLDTQPFQPPVRVQEIGVLLQHVKQSEYLILQKKRLDTNEIYLPLLEKAEK